MSGNQANPYCTHRKNPQRVVAARSPLRAVVDDDVDVELIETACICRRYYSVYWLCSQKTMLPITKIAPNVLLFTMWQLTTRLITSVCNNE